MKDVMLNGHAMPEISDGGALAGWYWWNPDIRLSKDMRPPGVAKCSKDWPSMDLRGFTPSSF